MGELQCGNVHPGGITDGWIRVPGNRNLSQPRAALCWQARLAESVSRKGFFLCLGRTRFRANYSCTVPELQGGEGCQESLMQPPETLQDDWNRKGSNAAGSIIASGFGRLLPYSSEREINRDRIVLCMHLTHLFIQVQAEINISQTCVDLQMLKNSTGLLHSYACF